MLLGGSAHGVSCSHHGSHHSSSSSSSSGACSSRCAAPALLAQSQHAPLSLRQQHQAQQLSLLQRSSGPAPSSSSACRATKGFGPEVKKPEVTSPADLCPCSSGKNYKYCCKKVHLDPTKAGTAEAALRARFAAYIKGEDAYVKASTHPDFFPFHFKEQSQDEAAAQFDQDVQTACTKVDYSDFKVMKVEQGASQDEAFVAFNYKHASKSSEAPAGFREGSELAEEDRWNKTSQKCRFLRVDGVWKFVDYETYEHANMKQYASDVQVGPRPNDPRIKTPE